MEQERKRSKLPFIGRKSVPKKGKEEKHQDELQDVQNFDDQETHQNNVCLEGLRRRWKRIRKVSAFLGVNLLSRDGLARRVYGCPKENNKNKGLER